MRCQHPECKKKISLVMLEANKCQCGSVYCGKHRLPEMHACTFDFKVKAKEILKKHLVKVKAEKVIAI
jgi:predicted nucleic acid binding AN1-type Zn finger protein